MIRDYTESSRMLKALRVEKDYTSHAIARKMKIDPATYIKRENNTNLITISYMFDLAEAFDVSISRIVSIFFTKA